MINFKVWLSALRIKTLIASIAPVSVGFSLSATKSSEFPIYSFLGCLLFALLLQVGTNFANDYYDFKRGADNDRRLGPTRYVASGLIPPETMFFAFLMVFSLSFIVGCLTVWYAGVSLFFLPFGLVCILCGYLYTGGPFPFAYNALGDVFVILFFGLGAVEGCNLFFSQVLHSTWTPSLSISFGMGLLVNNLLVVNNYRDHDTDKRVGKKTLITLLGRKFGLFLYLFGFSFAGFLCFVYNSQASILLITSIFGACGFLSLKRSKSKKDFNLSLLLTALTVIVFSVQIVLASYFELNIHTLFINCFNSLS